MSLAQTFLQDMRVNYPSDLDKYELRVTNTGLLKAVLDMTNSPRSIVSDDLKTQAMNSQGRKLDVPVMQRGNVTIKNARSCNVACAQSQSGLVTIVFKTVVADICIVPSQYGVNEISKQGDFNRKLIDTVDAFMIEIENDLDTALDANKSQVYNSSIIGSRFNLAGGAIQVPATSQKTFFNYLNSINQSDDFYNPSIKVIASPPLMPEVEFYINQGDGNNENLNFQFAGKSYLFSNRITDAPTAMSTGYFMEDGAVGLITRVDVDARSNHKSTNGTEWFEDRLAGMPFNVGVKYDSTCSDQKALETAGLAHLEATLVEHWQLSFDYGIVVPYNSDIATKPSVIRKFEFVA